MKQFYLTLSAVLLAGCAATPEQMAAQSNWDVCRFTMGGPHAQVAQVEAQRRNLDCQPYYGPIVAKQQAQNAAMSNYLRSTTPPPAPIVRQRTHCTSQRLGDTIDTYCR